MLKTHMDGKEDVLVVNSRVPGSSGHSLHKGTPREVFIKEFLRSHLAENVAIGTGELIDSNSKPKESRNQHDIVIYKHNYPKLDFGGGISAFLIESVVATIEVKSTLTEADIGQAVGAARNAKVLTPHVNASFQTGYIPPKVLNYVVAYDGPTHMQTVYNWVSRAHQDLSIATPDLTQGKNRLSMPSPSLDGIFILKKGFVYFDNTPVGFATDQYRAANQTMKWVYADTETGNLLVLFILLLGATSNIEGKWLDAIPYLATFRVNAQFV